MTTTTTRRPTPPLPPPTYESATADVPVAQLIVQPRGAEDRDSGPPVAPVASADGPVPRVVHQNTRSPGGGLYRWKMRCVDEPLQHVTGGRAIYILAADEASARECYLWASGLAAYRDAAVAAGADLVRRPTIMAKRLED